MSMCPGFLMAISWRGQSQRLCHGAGKGGERHCFDDGRLPCQPALKGVSPGAPDGGFTDDESIAATQQTDVFAAREKDTCPFGRQTVRTVLGKQLIAGWRSSSGKARLIRKYECTSCQREDGDGVWVGAGSKKRHRGVAKTDKVSYKGTLVSATPKRRSPIGAGLASGTQIARVHSSDGDRPEQRGADK